MARFALFRPRARAGVSRGFLPAELPVVRRLPWLVFLLLAPLAARADTVIQTNAQGKPVVIQRDAIVVKEDSAYLFYKHFDLKERRVVRVSLNKGTLPYSVQTSTPSERQQIVETWKRFGHKTSVTDQAGKTTRVFDAYLDFYPPGGRGSLLESLPARTNLPLLLEGGGADEVEFSQISRIEFRGEVLRVTVRDGRTEEGKFLMPTDKPAEVRFLGITDRYDPASEEVFDFSVPLSRLKEIRFD